MIAAFTGVPGSGKSLHCAKIIYERLSKHDDKPVIANFDVNRDSVDCSNFHYRRNAEMTVDYLISFSREWFSSRPFSEGQLLLVIDEAQILFNSRTSVGTRRETSERLQWVEFFSQHRKYGYTVYLITQDVKFIDKQFRFLIEQECHHSNFAAMGLPGFLLRIRYLGAKHLATWRYFGVKDILYTEMVRGNDALYGFYNSYGIFASLDDSK